MLVATAMVVGSMPVTAFAARLDYEPEETEVPQIAETEEEKETSKPTVKETKPTEKETEPEVKETEPEAKETEPEVKETEPAKEAEETKETEAPKAEEPEETVKADEEKPEESENADEPVTEKAPEAKASVKAKNAADFINKEIKFSNGKLSWNAVDGAASYGVSVCGGGNELETNACSCDIGSYIDQLIENREIYSDTWFTVYIYAHDADGDKITYTEFTFKYNTTAKPKTTLPAVTNLKIDNGVLTWDAYDNNGNPFAGYDIRIIGDGNALGNVESDKTSFDLKSYIAEQVSYGYKELTSYQVQVIALEYITWKPMAESGLVTYNYKKANTMTAKGKTVKASKSKAKKKNQSFKRSKVLTVKKAIGKLTYVKASGNAKITINKTSGKLTVKKKIKKGTYTVRISVKAAGDSTHVALTKTVTVKVKVK